MNANKEFINLSKYFWADIRIIGQDNGYTVKSKQDILDDNSRIKGEIKVPTFNDIINVYNNLSLNTLYILDENNKPTPYALKIIDYFKYRADILQNEVKNNLMDLAKAKETYELLVEKHEPTYPPPMNKQKNEKKAPAYFTAIINILLEANLEGLSCNFDPRKLATIVRDGIPLRTFARRVDGAFPSTINPIALWEIKEYYYTTTFGSRVADGIYETLLDGMELEELYKEEKIKVFHYLMVDDYNTWWNSGKSYLCRMIDMIHMGYVDEVLFGYEVVEKLPIIIKKLVDIEKNKLIKYQKDKI